LAKSTKSSDDKAMRQALRRRVEDVTDCHKQLVVRTAVQRLYLEAKEETRNGPKRPVGQVVASFSDHYIATVVAHAGVIEARRRQSRRRKGRRQVRREGVQYRGQRGVVNTP
jgi:hypothetical protein